MLSNRLHFIYLLTVSLGLTTGHLTLGQGLPCQQDAVAVSVARTCPCDGDLGYAGGCQSSFGSGNYCNLLSAYQCSEGCSTYFFYGETANTCLTSAHPKKHNMEQLEAVHLDSEGALESRKQSSRVGGTSCRAMSENFYRWLSQQTDAPRKSGTGAGL